MLCFLAYKMELRTLFGHIPLSFHHPNFFPCWFSYSEGFQITSRFNYQKLQAFSSGPKGMVVAVRDVGWYWQTLIVILLAGQLCLNSVFCDHKWRLKHLCCNVPIEVGVKLWTVTFYRLHAKVLQIACRRFHVLGWPGIDSTLYKAVS